MEHTPTPWKAYQNALGIWSISTDSELIGQIWRHFNAEHIVKCVNSYDKLVEALKEAKEWLSEEYPTCEPLLSINKALAEAGS